MKIKLYRSSTVGIHFDDFKLLTDPWLTDGEYYGAWSHYPYFDIDKNLNELNSYDAIYVSHIHPDHCSINTLKRLDKTIPIYIHKFHSPFLKFKIERLGFRTVEIENGQSFVIGKNTSITIYAADNCDPELCYKFTGCANVNEKNISQQIDTLSIIENNGEKIVNVNDCPFELAQHPLRLLKEKFKDIDILLTGYGGAGPYPQCFDNLNSDQIDIEAKKEESFLNQAYNFVELVEPKYFLPFAGTYTLTGKLSKLQKHRGVPDIDYACKFIDNKLKLNDKNKINSIKIGPDDIFDIQKPKVGDNFNKFNSIDQDLYVEEFLSKQELEYEKDEIPSSEEIFSLAKSAFKRFLEKKKLFNSKIETDIIIDFGSNLLLIPFDEETNDIEIKDKKFVSNNKYILLKLDVRLLKRILMGPKYAHWNNAEIGSHINYFRSPNIYNRNLHTSLCYFHN